MKKILKRILNNYWKIQLLLFKFIDSNGFRIIGSLCNAFYHIYPNYCSYRLYPLSTKKYVDTKVRSTTSKGELAIVLQGIVAIQDDCTLETVRLYKKIFPSAIIILSTWDFTSDELLQKFREEGCEIVLCKTFKPCGFGNVNYQVYTSLQGARRAKELGAKYVLKNRSDLRIYKEFSFEYLKSLLGVYPVLGTKVPLKGRIVTFVGATGQLFLPYWLQDFLYFGYTDDIINLFDIKQNERDIANAPAYFKREYKYCTGEDMCREVVPEIYITKMFLSKYINIDDSVKGFWECIKNYFMIVDWEDLSAVLFKYDSYNRNDGDTNGILNWKESHRMISHSICVSIINGYLKYGDWMEKERFNYILHGKKE